MNVRRTHRPGLTLTESLVALFVMALGLLSLLTLFPLGALQIGQALKDDRCGQTALQADGYLRAYWQRNVVEPPHLEDNYILRAMENPGALAPLGSSISRVFSENPMKIESVGHGLSNGQQVFIRDVEGSVSANGQFTVTKVDDNNFTIGIDGSTAPAHVPNTGLWVLLTAAAEPSYPILVDPLGYASLTGAKESVASFAKIPRRGFAAAGIDPLRTCCMMDDLTFGEAGSGFQDKPVPGGWQARYNWSAILQHKRNDTTHQADFSVLVFDQRLPLVQVNNPEIRVTATANVTPGVTSSVTITLPTAPGIDADAVYIRKGGWIMDGSQTILNLNTPTEVVPIRNGNFYRISGVTDNGGGSFTLDLETPIKPLWNNSSGSRYDYPGTFYLFAGLAEVFQRPELNRLFTP